MPLLTPRFYYKPFEYSWAYEAWKKQQCIHWLPAEVSLNSDVYDWKCRLTIQEKNLLTQVFRFFTQADVEVNNCYITHYSRVFQPPEIRMMLAAFSNMETIHEDAYSYLVDTLGIPDSEYKYFLEYKAMKDKYDYMQRFNTDSREDIALTLGAFGAFVEGLQLFASFAILLNFQLFGKMKGMGQIVGWSARDESLHTASIIRLFKTFIEENPDLWTEDLRSKLYQICYDMVMHEEKFIDLAFEMGDIQGLTSAEVKQYIYYVANKRLQQLGLKTIYSTSNNKSPLPWLDALLNSVEHTNFLENRVNEYSRSSTQGTWEEAFAE